MYTSYKGICDFLLLIIGDNIMELGKRAVLYCRLSKEDINKENKNDDSESIKNQILLLTDYALSQGFSIVDVYQDDDYSGLFNDRPGFERLLEDAKLQKFDIVIAKTQSRFTRNMEHMEKYLHNFFPLLGIRFIGVIDNVDTANKGNKKSRQINGLINEWYCEDLSENIRAVFKTKMKAGQFLGSSTPYGYVKDPNNHHHLIIDEYAANVVRKIFSLFISGHSKTSIMNILNKDKILIPTLYKQQVLEQNYHNANATKETKFWSFQTILSILKNEVYTGAIVQNKCNVVSYKTKKKKATSPQDWIKADNMHEAIIEKDIWELAQKQLQIRTKTIDLTQKIDTFSGKLFCKDCGKTLCRKYNNKHEFVGYHCRTYKKSGNSGCTAHNIKVEELENIVLSTIKNEARQILTMDDINELSNITFVKSKTKHLKMQISELQKQLSTINKHKKKHYENLLDDILTKDEYLKFKSECEEKCLEIEQDIENINTRINNENETTNEYDSWVDKFKNYIDIEELDRNVIMELVNKIVLDAEGTLHIYFNFESPYKNEIKKSFQS